MPVWELRKAAGFEALVRASRQTPRPRPGEVLVRVRAASINYRDLQIIQLQRPEEFAREPPLIPLSDAAGEVVAIGDGVDTLRVGDRVASSFFQGWQDGDFEEHVHDTALGSALDGTLAEYVILRASAAVRLPKHLSFEEGATLPCAALTAWNALFEVAPLAPGETVLVQGTGGVSIFGLCLAKAAGARVIVTSSSDDKLVRARELGADGVINYRSNPAWSEEARRLTGGRGVDLVLDVGGSGTFSQSVAAVRAGGTISAIGDLGGLQIQADMGSVIDKALRVRGVYVGSVAMFQRMARAFEVMRLRPILDRAFDFADARAAYEHLASGRHFGKVVIRGA